MHTMVGRDIKIYGFDNKGEKYFVSKGTLTDYTETKGHGVTELRLHYEGAIKIIKVSSGMVIEESPG